MRTRSLDHLLTLCRGGVAPLLAQHLAPFGRKLLEAAETLPHPRLIGGRQLLEALPARALFALARA